MGGELVPLPSWNSLVKAFQSFERELEKVTAELFTSIGGEQGFFRGLPEPRITETVSGVEVRFPVRGAAPGSVDVMVSPRQIGIQGHISRREGSNDGRVLRAFSESFYRVVPLPVPVDPDSAVTEVLKDVIVVRVSKAK